MDYEKIYKKLIVKGQTRTLSDHEYKEIHHIVPSCMDGTDNASNLVALTPEEHYTAHLLLVKIYPYVSGLVYASMMMCSKKETRIGNKRYGWLKRKFINFLKIEVKNRWARKYGYKDYYDQSCDMWNDYVNLLIPVIEIQKTKRLSVNNVRNSLRFYAEINDSSDLLKAANKKHKSITSVKTRNNFTPEQESKRIKAVKNIDYEARTKKIGSRVGENNPVYGKTWSYEKEECPYCKKMVAGKRWHFENCKEKK